MLPIIKSRPLDFMVWKIWVSIELGNNGLVPKPV